ncbi:MAG: 4Fe-4S dicluster domain-containing protein [Bacteroides sp.]|nr:4Fe-4S dicluster domain-containing protein [Bacteroides sp.]
MEKTNINSPRSVNPCTSCSMCAALCPVQCISIVSDTDGFLHPVTDEDKCIGCGLCVKVCYKFDHEVQPQPQPAGQLYAAVADEATVNVCTSGGVGDVLARYLTSQGIKCAGVVYDDKERCARHIVTDNPADTRHFRGSKYIQSYTVDAFRQLVAEVSSTRYAVFGLPCHIYALHRWLTLRGLRDNCLLIDLYCHGCPTRNAFTKCAASLEARMPEGAVPLSLRFRDPGLPWGKTYELALTYRDSSGAGGRIADKDFYRLFFSDLLLNESCYDCRLRSTLVYTDIRIGDFWGPLYAGNTRGVSAVSVVTPQGKAMMAEVSDRLTLTRHDYSQLLPYQSYSKIYKYPGKVRSRMLKQLADPEIPVAVTISTLHRNKPLKSRLRYALRQFLKRFSSR